LGGYIWLRAPSEAYGARLGTEILIVRAGGTTMDVAEIVSCVILAAILIGILFNLKDISRM
jgi:hypothetical protein